MNSDANYLSGKLLVAMPSMGDPRFASSLVYLCAHSSDGAMGLIVNKRAEALTLTDLFGKVGIPVGDVLGSQPVHYGGPVEMGRGFVLHSADYHASDATLRVDDQTSMTATIDVLQAMADERGPEKALVTLGYAGWAPLQLEAELQANGWLTVDPDPELLFGVADDQKWNHALKKIGIDPAFLTTGGTA